MKFFLLGLLVIIGSCGTVKTAHTDNVKLFARSAKILSGVPGKLYGDMADYRHELKMVEVSTIHRSEKLVEELDKIAAVNRRYQNNALQITTSTALIESYAECLLALTDAAYQKQLVKQSDELTLQLNTAFDSYNTLFNQRLPLSVGRFIGGVITQVGSIKLRKLQRKYLRSFVDTGSLLINDVCDYYTGTVAPTVENELSSLDNQFTNVMTHFYDNIYEYQKQQSINPFDYLRQYNPLYLELKERLAALHDLQGKTITAIQRIKTAHQSLQTLADTTLPVETLADIKELYLATRDINATLKKTQKK